MFLSCLLGTLAVLLILIFFFFLGCPFEFIKCYLNKKENANNDNDSDDDSDLESQRQSNRVIAEEDKEIGCKEISMCVLLALLGILCQPFYLLFYVLYGMMECYRRFGCWFYYAAY